MTESQEDKLYNKLLLLSRNKLLYSKFALEDSFQNRINLIFIHSAFLFIKIKQIKNDNLYKNFYQKMFDLIFKRIEQNMREIGWGDVTVNKNMKYLVRVYYDILLNSEKYNEKDNSKKVQFLKKYFTLDNDKKTPNIDILVNYFDKYRSFCIDLSPNNVIKGDVNFNYE